MTKRRKYNARAKKNASHAKPNNVVAAVGHCVLEERTIWSNVQAYPMECICCAAAFPESMTVVRDVYDVSQSGVHDSLQNLQVVDMILLVFVPVAVEYLISRLSHNNVDETDATLSSQLREPSEPEWWHQVPITTVRTRRTSQDGGLSVYLDLNKEQA
ncbi:hypothetical protein M513_11457 [Trichuris suis]|uniref:Uncharacterized protein n=1 Tax=Trichuris suis TaxID=68888 RepID=A0A085LRS0_9BILA|nr:hypothetical protein M513_11457 [Trichuris suis]